MITRLLFIVLLITQSFLGKCQVLIGSWQMKEVASKIQQDGYRLDTIVHLTPGEALLKIKNNWISFTYTANGKSDKYSRKVKNLRSDLIELPTTIYARGEFGPRDFLFYGDYTIIQCNAKYLILEKKEAGLYPSEEITVHRISFERLPE